MINKKYTKKLIYPLAILLFLVISQTTYFFLEISFYIMMMMYLYLSYLSLFGWKKPKRKYQLIEDKTRFLILIPCHNEEFVIKDTIENIYALDYDKDKFLVMPINDYSKDQTKVILENMNIPFINSEDHDFKLNISGKQRALQTAILALGEEYVKTSFDLITIFDADNRVESNFLKEINSQWQGEGKPEAIQAYLDSRNHDTLLSSGYAVSYWIMNNSFQLAKYRLGLPNSIGGTGYSVDATWLIENGGFNYVCLTEDLAMEIRIVLTRGRVLWNHFTKIYDEKPTKLKSSIVQRTRWAQGHWYIFFTSLTSLLPIVSVFKRKQKKNLKNFVESFRWRYIDQILYTMSQGKSVQLILIILYGILLFSVSHYSADHTLNIMGNYLYLLTVPYNILTLLLFLYNFIIQPILSTILFGNKKWFTSGIIGFNYFSLTYLWCMILGLFKWRNQDIWISTEHHNVTSIEKNKI